MERVKVKVEAKEAVKAKAEVKEAAAVNLVEGNS